MSPRRLGEPLALVTRSGEVESIHAGHLVVVTAEGRVLVSRGDPDTAVWVRSSVKPLQVLPLLLSGAADALALAPETLAVAQASHSGTDRHRAVVQALMTRAGLPLSALRCGRHTPYDEATAHALIRAGAVPDTLRCNCSGKHAAMLVVCQHLGWDLAGYRDPDHPLQRWIRDLLAAAAGVPSHAVGVGVDGCGAPVWRLSVRGLAQAYARVASGRGLNDDVAAAAARALEAFARHPELVAGPGRLDTALVGAGAGRLVAKIGGEAVHAGAWLGEGPAWALKVTDGGKRAIGPALARALTLAGCPLPPSPGLAGHLAPEVINNLGARVGEVRPAF
ncbi:MAG: asparaginase [Candidatus Sericytochromatia bacterium]|nr:asparaginase [Candidatus Sericytochromatia bacterium]